MTTIIQLKLNVDRDIPYFRSMKSNHVQHDGDHLTGDPEKLCGEARALLSLLGGYNSFGRKCDLAKFEAIERKFRDAIYELSVEL